MAEDDDLVDDFLAAAGLGGSSSRDSSIIQSPPTTRTIAAPKKRRAAALKSSAKAKRRKRWSDSESDAPEISEDELEDIAITPPPRGGGRRNVKRDISPDDDEDGAFANPYPLEGKYKDEEDRERLLGMTEIEREQVLFSRAEEMQRFKEKRDLAALVKSKAHDQQPRRSGREGQLRSEKAGKRGELSELVKAREERSNAQKVKTPTKARDTAEDNEDDESVDSGEYFSDEDRKKVDESNLRITYDNVSPITLTRNFFSRYSHYPQFESTIIGCFTRVRISEREDDYRFARIEGLVTASKYTVEGTPVDQGLELSQGSSGGKKVITMDFASNSPVTQREFDRYVKMVQEGGGTMPSRKHLDKKVREVQELQEYKLKDADITAMIEKKKSLSRIPKNLVHEKTRLKQLHLAALSSGNESEAERIQDQLSQLEELAQGSRDRGISRENQMFLKVNERNRKMNLVEMREAGRRGAEERRRNALSTDMAIMDPFSRRKTIPKTFYENLASSRGGSPAPSSGVSTPVLGPTSAVNLGNLNLDAVAAASSAVNGNGKVKVEDVIAQADFGIDIEI